MDFQASSRYYLLLSASVFWILLILAAPFLSFYYQEPGSYIYLFFSGICHQQPDRCFLLKGLPMAVCARCFGLYAGFIPGLLASAYIPRFRNLMLGHPRLLILFVLPMLIDLLLPNTHWSRFITGMAASFPVAVFVHQAIDQIHLKPIRSTIT